MMSSTTKLRGFQLRPLPLAYRALGKVLAVSSKDPWPASEPEAMVAAAAREVGEELDLPSHIERALDALCRSVRDDANLHWVGRANIWDLAVSGLAQWRELENLFARRPELENVPLNDPIIVTGLPRSGTTFLHRLLASCDDARSIPMYEHLYPVPPSGMDLRRWRAEGIFIPWWLVARQYGVDAIHLVRPTLAEECTFSMRLGMASFLFWDTAPTYSYVTWLLEQDLTETYRIYRRVLQLIQSAHPGERLVLKCPSHCPFLPALTEVLPEAQLVVTHREPRVTVASESSFILSLHATATGHLDWRRTVRAMLDKTVVYAERLAAFVDSETSDRIQHVAYRQLVSNPVQVAAEIRRKLGLPWSAAHERELSRFVSENRQHKHGHHRYSLERFEIDPEICDSRFAGYRSRFSSWLQVRG